MEKLDEWTDEVIIRPLLEHWLSQEAGGDAGLEAEVAVEESIKRSIREKVLESYRNGQQAGPRRVAQEAVKR